MTAARLLLPALRLPQDAGDFDRFLRLAERGVGGFCVFGGDAGLRGLLRRLQAAAPHRLLFCSDLEEGAGQQVAGLPRHPPAAALGPAAAEVAGARTAAAARAAGLTMTFAPVCDVVSESRNPILFTRAFADPAASAPRFVAGARGGGLRTCAKHFPGHGAAAGDSHDSLPRVDADAATWRARDLPPFAACFAAGVDAVMTAHVACPALTGSPTLPATLSPRVLRDLLRDEMGFDGLVVTDALLMEGVRQGRSEAEAALAALAAGCDALLCPTDPAGILDALAGVEAPDACARVAAAAEPLADPLVEAARASLTAGGELPLGAGEHPLRYCDLNGGGEGLGGSFGRAWERLDLAGAVVARGTGRGFDRPVALFVRRDRAWGGPLELPDALRAVARASGLVVALGRRGLLDGFEPPAWIHAPGDDPATLDAVAERGWGA